MKGEFITLETAKRIEQIKQNRRKHENQHEKMNMSIVDANIKLQDENKLLKNDNEILKKRTDKAIEYIENHMQHNTGMNCADMTDLVDILKGESIWEK